MAGQGPAVPSTDARLGPIPFLSVFQGDGLIQTEIPSKKSCFFSKITNKSAIQIFCPRF